MQGPSDKPTWPDHVVDHLKRAVIDADDHLDAMRTRFRRRFRAQQPRHIAAYRGFGDASGIEFSGRVLAERPQGGPKEEAPWWDNLLDTYRRFESDEVPNLPLRLHVGAAVHDTTTDHEGYYRADLPNSAPVAEGLWTHIMATLADGSLPTPQPILQVPMGPGIGVISDIDDTVLQSGIVHWKTAAQLTFLHNARTRKPLDGVARLYHALQAGPSGAGEVPIFYVSSSPWNLYDLLEDFMELNGIPAGPMFLRDLGTDPGKFLKTAGHGHKLDRARLLIDRFPERRWILLGDSGQADAELYAQAADDYGDRIAAIYIRDVDPDGDTERDRQVDGHIERVGPTGVPMMRVRNSDAIAAHAHEMGWIAADWLNEVASEVKRDENRPELAEAALEGTVPTP